jgi:hypothetical protein
MNLYIGIDPAKGWAVWSPRFKKLIDVDTVDFWEIISRLDESSKSDLKLTVYCEAPQNNRPTWIKGKNNLCNSKISQNVGENKRMAKLIIEYCKKVGITVIPCTPTKRSVTKLSHDEFCKLTGWPKERRTSEHGRDAAMLVFGK